MQILIATLIVMSVSAWAQSDQFDIVIQRGRVIDPETQLDAVRDVGIINGRIAAVSEQPLRGKFEVNAAGMVVGPGFVDLHTHAVNVPSFWMQAFDGVTTSL